MIDHISVGVADIDRARAFYDAVLAPLGYRRVMDFGHAAGYGVGRPQFWIGVPHKKPVSHAPGSHVAFTAIDRPSVDAFFNAALAAGGTDNGAPGVRGHYHPDYYAAFVIDPDGNRVEAVCHRPID